MNTDFAYIAGIYKTNTDLFQRAVNGLQPEQWLRRPGNDSNHVMFLAGHLVHSRALVLKSLGSEWPSPWPQLFGRGAKLADAGEYPSPAEITAAWAEVSGKLAGALSTATPEALAAPAPPGPPTLDGKIGGLIAFLALHETYHIGQVAFLARWMGQPQLNG
jgi:uncharacterized damage-inducible protein DinB